MKSNFFVLLGNIEKVNFCVFRSIWFGKKLKRVKVNDVSSSDDWFFSKAFFAYFCFIYEIRERERERLCWLLIQLCNDTRWNLQLYMQREKLFQYFVLDEEVRKKKCKRKEKEADWQASDSIWGLSYFLSPRAFTCSTCSFAFGTFILDIQSQS